MPGESKLNRRNILIALFLLVALSWSAALYEHRLKLSKENLDLPALAARQLGTLFNLFLLAVHGTLLVGIGLAPLRAILVRRSLPQNYLLPLCFVFSALIGYGVFWLYFLNPMLGLISSAAILLLAIRELVVFIQAYRAREPWIAGVTSTSVLQPLILIFAVAATYHCTLAIFQRNPPGYIYDASVRLLQLPGDNEIPFTFANRLWNGEDPRQIQEFWLSSDRPPLQTGMVLIQRLLVFLPGNDFDRQYQVLATLIQCQWVAAVWLLCRELCVSARKSRRVILLCAATGFFFLNSIFVWPKLLAGSLLIFSFVFMLPVLLRKKPLSVARATAAATAAMLAFLAHGGAAFNILALILLGLPLLRFWRSLIPAVAVAILLYIPWSLYQKLYNPPGDRLLKWHIAGVESEKDPRTFPVMLREEYGKLSAHDWLHNKAVSLSRWIYPPNAATMSDLRHSQFFGLVPALGVLNVGWILYAIRRRHIRAARRLRWMLLLAAVSLFVWLLIIFGPGGTVNHTNAYATMMLLFTACAIPCANLSGTAARILFALHYGSFFLIWIFTTPDWDRSIKLARLNIPMALCAMASCYLLAKYCESKRDCCLR